MIFSTLFDFLESVLISFSNWDLFYFAFFVLVLSVCIKFIWSCFR